MSQRQIQFPLMENLESIDAAGGAAGPSFRMGGRPTAVHIIVAPAALVQIQVSMDRVNWVIGEDRQGNALTTLAAGYHPVALGAEWIRCFITQDASAPRFYDAVAHVVEDTEG